MMTHKSPQKMLNSLTIEYNYMRLSKVHV